MHPMPATPIIRMVGLADLVLEDGLVVGDAGGGT
jgi:hypothetical protein